jgi:hypothetical protein
VDRTQPILRFLLETDDEDLVKDAGYQPVTVEIRMKDSLWNSHEQDWQRKAPREFAEMESLWDRGYEFKVQSRPTSYPWSDSGLDAAFRPDDREADVMMWFEWDAHQTVLEELYGPPGDDEEQEIFDDLHMELVEWLEQRNLSEVVPGKHRFFIVRTVEGLTFTTLVMAIGDLENALIVDEDKLAGEFANWKREMKRKYHIE